MSTGKKNISNHVKVRPSKGKRSFGQTLSSTLHNLEENSPDITISTFGTPLNVSLIIAKSLRKFLTPDDCVNLKSVVDLSGRNLIIALQRTCRGFGTKASEPGISHFLTN